MKIKDIITEKKQIFENYLCGYLAKNTFEPKGLFDAVCYSLTNGGKRIRPIITMLSAEFLGVELTPELMKLMLALECIHTYSLIHDDLPSMDNDDYRRGKLTSHKMFGEATAVLAGDSLLNLAFELTLDVVKSGDGYRKAAKYLAENAGVKGMIGGQYLDVNALMDTEKDFIEMYDKKTGGLIRSAFMMPYFLADTAIPLSEYEDAARSFALIFQLTDDILDFEKELNFASKFGKDKTYSLINTSIKKINRVFSGEKGKAISELAGLISVRKV